MDLTWWPVAVAGSVCLTVCVALAVLLPMHTARRRLRPLAHVDRLTRLPEYINVVRLQATSMLMLVALLVIVFLLALLTGSRPAGPAPAASVHREDTMLCVGDPVTDPGTAGLLNYFARRTVDFDTQRIGLTSPTLRVVPLTSDYQFAADDFSRFAKLAALQQDVDAKQPMAGGRVTELRTGINQFSPPLNYVDYARSTEDVLALCMAGFPTADANNGRRRSLIYFGPSAIRGPDEQRPSLFSEQQIKDMAAAGGIQVNVIAGPDPSPSADDLRSLAAATGGRFEAYDATGTGAPGTGADLSGGTDPALAAILDAVWASPPRPAVTAGANPIADAPTVPLVAGIVVSALLCISLAVLRR